MDKYKHLAHDDTGDDHNDDQDDQDDHDADDHSDDSTWRMGANATETVTGSWSFSTSAPQYYHEADVVGIIVMILVKVIMMTTQEGCLWSLLNIISTK